METSSPLNPYAPPAAPTDSEPAPDGAPTELASLGRRWLGAAVDNIVAIVLMRATGMVFDLGTARSFFDFDTTSLFGWAPFLAVWALQSYFIATRGQSIGKMLLRMRIVDMDGNRSPFVRAAVVRTWVFLALFQIPVVGQFIHIADVLCIFGRERRCLHDMLAGTKVVNVHPISDPITT